MRCAECGHPLADHGDRAVAACVPAAFPNAVAVTWSVDGRKACRCLGWRAA